MYIFHICILLWKPFNSSFFGQAASFSFRSLAVTIYRHVVFLYIGTHCVGRVFEANSNVVNNFSSFYATRKFIVVFTTTRLWCLTYARWISAPSLISFLFKIRFYILLCPLLGLPSSLFPSGSIPSKIWYVTIFVTFYIPAVGSKCLVIFGEEHKSWNSSLFNIIQLSVTLCSVASNILLNILCSKPQLPLGWESRFVGAVLFLHALCEQHWLIRKFCVFDTCW
jgi:hypothetical protein